jgi:chromosome segregation protein
VARLNTSRERLETFLERSGDLLHTLRSSIGSRRVEAAAAGEKRQEVARRLAEAESILGGCQKAVDKVEAEVAEAKREEGAAREVLQGQEQLAERRRSDLLRTISALTASRNRLGELEREQDRLAYSKTQLEQEGERLTLRREDVTKRHEEAVATLRTCLDAAAEIDEKRSNLVESRAKVREQAQSSKAAAEGLSHTAWELRHRLAGIERELASHQAAADRLTELVPEELILGQVSDWVHPDPEVASVLDRVWRDLLQLPVVRGERGITELLGDLSGIDERLRIVVTDEQGSVRRWPEPPGATSLLSAAGLSDMAKSWLLRALPPAFTAESTDDARALAGRYPDAVFLAPDGVVWRGCTAETPAEGAKLQGALVLRAEKEDLAERIEQTTRTAEASSEKHRGLQAELDRIDVELTEVDRRAVQIDQERGRAAAVEESLGQERARLEKEITALSEEHRRIDDLVAKLEQRREKTTAEVASLQARSEELESAVEQAGEALDGARDAAADHLRRLDRWTSELRLARERHSAARREVDRLRSEASQLETQHGALTRQKAELETELAETEHEVVRSRARLAEEQGALVSARQRERVEAERVDDLVDHVQRLDQEVRRRRDAHEAARDALHSTQMEVGALDGEWARLRDACVADIGETPESLLARPVPEHTNIDELKERGETLRARIEKMGPVNLLALKEVEELQGRSEFLATQRADLVESLRSLDETIREIDATCTERFVDTFERVNELFVETFSHLFGGGSARLELVDEDDPLESGIDVIAQPPGKKNQSVQLLSGGEKALTALALLIALFRIKPSPFCILDEVDAPLDDANVERLAELVRSMTAHTQFVMITHNRRTMQRADVLYGVTMEEAGVSKIVSVRIEQ